MELVKPAIGLLFWMTVSFGILLFLLGKFAWKPILKLLRDREDSIRESLEMAKKAKEDMARLQNDHEKMNADARIERDNLLKEARQIREELIGEAKDKAQAEAARIMANAKEEINNQKLAAITEIQNQVAVLSLEIAEKILRSELTADEKQKALMKTYMKEVNLN